MVVSLSSSNFFSECQITFEIYMDNHINQLKRGLYNDTIKSNISDGVSIIIVKQNLYNIITLYVNMNNSVNKSMYTLGETVYCNYIGMAD